MTDKMNIATSRTATFIYLIKKEGIDLYKDLDKEARGTVVGMLERGWSIGLIINDIKKYLSEKQGN